MVGPGRPRIMTKTIRLDKYLTDCRTGSRSEVKNLIRKGLVKVNEATCTDPALHISTSDHVSLDGRTVEYKQHVYYMLNKPAGYVSATKDDKERTVLDLFPEDLRKRLF
ncbi:MAG: 16S rRNA pseudouridine(516) synthase, partial [Lachnospiraceae bacterium]|nr:16S rRNA pseudouridine(516) synthase [Lachnospiraceae bacterium]